MRSDASRGYASIMGAATLWATVGLFYTKIGAYGVPAPTAVFVRGLVTFFILLLGLALLRPHLLRVRRKDLPFFALMGLLTVALFFTTYAYAIYLLGVSVAAVLQYTAPAFVTVLAWRFFGEGLDARKLAALGLAFGGCLLVARVYDPAQVRLNLPGVLWGLAAGFTYALYTLFSKRAVRSYSPWTVLTYNMGFGVFFLGLTQSPSALTTVTASPMAMLLIVIMAIGPTVGSHGLYVTGLTKVPASAASIMSTLEPVLAAILAYVVLHETLEPPQLIGAAAVMAAIIILSRSAANEPAPKVAYEESSA